MQEKKAQPFESWRKVEWSITFATCTTVISHSKTCWTRNQRSVQTWERRRVGSPQKHVAQPQLNKLEFIQFEYPNAYHVRKALPTISISTNNPHPYTPAVRTRRRAFLLLFFLVFIFFFGLPPSTFCWCAGLCWPVPWAMWFTGDASLFKGRHVPTYLDERVLKKTRKCTEEDSVTRVL